MIGALLSLQLRMGANGHKLYHIIAPCSVDRPIVAGDVDTAVMSIPAMEYVVMEKRVELG